MARVHCKADGLNFSCHHVAEEFPGLRLGKIHQSLTLGSAGALIHNQNGLRRERVTESVTERSASTHDRGNAQSIESNVLPSAFLYVPRKDSLFAGEVDLRIGEARTGVNVRRPRFDVFARDMRGRLGRPRARGQSDQSPREKECRYDAFQFHCDYLPWSHFTNIFPLSHLAFNEGVLSLKS